MRISRMQDKKFKRAALVVALFALVGGILIYTSNANPNLPGDVNNDNVVNITDLSILLSNWGKTYSGNPTPPGTPPTPPSTPGSPTTPTCGTGGSANTPASPVSGYRLVKCEDFNNGFGAFHAYTGGGGSTVVGAGRTAHASQCKAEGGMLKQLQRSDGGTCGGLLQGWSQRFGYYEARVRAFSTGTTGSPPHPVLIIWPSSDRWADGELDFFETDIGNDHMGVYLHCVGNPSANCVSRSHKMDLTQWHTIGFEWTNNGFKGWVDGQETYSVGTSGANMPVAGHPTIQLDNLSGRTPVKAGEFWIDWFHQYQK